MTAGPAGVASDPIGAVGKPPQRPEYRRLDLFSRGMFRIKRKESSCTEGEMFAPSGSPQ